MSSGSGEPRLQLPPQHAQQDEEAQPVPEPPPAPAAPPAPPPPAPAAPQQFVRSNAGLTTVPVKVMAMTDLSLLDLSCNAIEVIPRGLFSDIPHLKTCDLSRCSIRALPDDVAALRELEALVLHHNCLVELPPGLFSLTGLRSLDVSYNRLAWLDGSIGDMEGLQVLNLAGNRLRSIPAEVGSLAGLKQLNVHDNADLHIPPHVLQQGFRAVMWFLQVVGEQHAQVETHLAAFSACLTELHARHQLALPTGGVEDEAAVMLQLRLAQRLGVLSCSRQGLATLPPGLEAQSDVLAGLQVLEAAHNRLRSLPTGLLGCVDRLLVLDLSANFISAWPEGLSMPGLAVLNLSFNKLERLPDDLGHQLPALAQLYLSNNLLTALPDSLARLKLVDLFASENGFQRLPPVLGHCSSLAKLSLAACQLAGPCEELAGLSNLHFLDLSFNPAVSCLSPRLSGLSKSLSALNLGFCALATWPDALSCLTSLRELNVDHTGITEFPPGLGELRLLEGLQADGCPLRAPFASLYTKDPLLLVALHDTRLLSLDLSDCSLCAVPEALQRQTQLTALSLKGKNSITELPAWLGSLCHLQQLALKGNPLRQPFAKLIDAHGELAVLSLLRPEGARGCLDLSACGFAALPGLVWEVAGRAEALQALDLTNNRLRELPQELAVLKSLTRLVLDSNMLRQLPDVVLKLPLLAVFQASGNSLTFLPDQIGQLMPNLQALVLASNQIRQLPDISGLTRLKSLSLASNRLWQLPGSLCSCTALRLLDCSHNLLQRLPADLAKLGALKSLKLAHNRLEWVPAGELAGFQGLEELDLAANPFTASTTTGEANASGRPAVQRLLAAIGASPFGRQPEPQFCPGRSWQPGSMNAAGYAAPLPGDASVSSFGGGGGSVRLGGGAGTGSISGSGSFFGLLRRSSAAGGAGQQTADSQLALQPSGSSIKGGRGSRSPSPFGGGEQRVQVQVAGDEDGPSAAGAGKAWPEAALQAGSKAVRQVPGAAASSGHASHSHVHFSAADDRAGAAAAAAPASPPPPAVWGAAEAPAAAEVPAAAGSSPDAGSSSSPDSAVPLLAVETGSQLQQQQPVPAANEQPAKPAVAAGAGQQVEVHSRQQGRSGKAAAAAPAGDASPAAKHKQPAAVAAPSKAKQQPAAAATKHQAQQQQRSPGTGAPSKQPGPSKPRADAAGQWQKPGQLQPPPSSLLEHGWLPLLQDADSVAAASGAPLAGCSLKMMDMPRIVRACMQAAPPPPAATNGGGPGLTARPQTRLRYRRVAEQSAAALALLEQALGAAQGASPTEERSDGCHRGCV